MWKSEDEVSQALTRHQRIFQALVCNEEVRVWAGPRLMAEQLAESQEFKLRESQEAESKGKFVGRAVRSFVKR